MNATALFDAPGPRARRRTWIGSIIAATLLIGMLVWLIVQLVANGQFAATKWLPFIQEPDLWPFIANGLLLTLVAAAVGLVLSLALGVALAVGRIVQVKSVRVMSTSIVEVLRGAPVLLMMLFFFLAFPALFQFDLPTFWTVVLALTLYNGAVICEIIRAGVAALPSGQAEAAKALGMRNMQVIRYIQFPQALRVMLPTLISQFIVLLKDTSLGFIIGYTELLQRGQAVSLLFGNPLQTFAIIAVIYISLNLLVSRLSHSVSNRQWRRPGRTPLVTELEPVTTAITLGVRPPRSL